MRSVFLLALAPRFDLAVYSFDDSLPFVRRFQPDLVAMVLNTQERSFDILLRSIRASMPRCPLILVEQSDRMGHLPDRLGSVQGIVRGPLDLNSFLRLAATLLPNPAAPTHHPFSSYTNRAFTYLAEHHAEPHLRVSSLATALSVSPDHFSRLFRGDTGMTVPRFVSQLRVEVAKSWLTDTDRKLAAIADVTGCTDAPHLARLFRRYAGSTPAAYRRLSRLALPELPPHAR